mgnify:CR=1 FL=1
MPGISRSSSSTPSSRRLASCSASIRSRYSRARDWISVAAARQNRAFLPPAELDPDEELDPARFAPAPSPEPMDAAELPGAGERMDELIADARARGGKVLAGGTRDGAVVAATVIDNVTPEMRVYAEESFGPVKPIIRVKGEEDALRVANESEYGLSSAVFSRDIKRAMAFADRLEAGICHINGPTVNDEPQAPFGGVKSSGYGRFGGKAGIAEFTEIRWVTVEDPNQHYPF